MNFYSVLGKRALDVSASVAGLVVLSPVLAATAIAVRVKLGAPVIFRQRRPGKDAQLFDLFKFRTMTDARDGHGDLLSDSERITQFGSFLRSTSLDELPELVNVLRGDMSLVGPRPLLTRYLPHYTTDERKRFGVRPGLTGWAQVHGRNSVSWDERLALDAWYADNVSLSLDVRIILKTLSMVLKRQGVAVVPTSIMRSLDVERASRG
ncbi:MAG: sugar transferase [Micrococcus sp.]|nr:sugar transferase [Micrococcus sp.]